MKIALYFGSFNPMHVGHLTICRYLMENCDIDELRLVVSPANPLKDESNEKSAEERLKHVKKVAANLEKEALQKGLKCKIHVSSIEFKLPKPLYTIDTLRTITEREKGNKLILIIGADNLAIIEKWNRWKELLNEFEVWVYPRKGYDIESLCKKYGVKPLNAPMIDISSSEIREAELSGSDMSAYKV